MYIFRLIEVPATDLQLAGSLPASVVMLASNPQLACSLTVKVAMLAIFRLIEVPASDQ